MRTDKQFFLPIHLIACSLFSPCSADRQSCRAIHRIARSTHLPFTLCIHAISPFWQRRFLSSPFSFRGTSSQPVNGFVVGTAPQTSFGQGNHSCMLPICTVHEANASAVPITATAQTRSERQRSWSICSYCCDKVITIYQSPLSEPKEQSNRSHASLAVTMHPEELVSFMTVQLDFPSRLPSWSIFMTIIHELKMLKVRPNSPLQLPA